MYPLMLDLTNRSVLVVGGGKVATGKVRGLLAADAKVTIISPDLAEDISEIRGNWIQRDYRPRDVDGYELIFACTNNKATNQLIVSDCHSGQWVNNTSQKDASSFYNMATVEDKGILYGISTFGESPSRAKKIKEDLTYWLKSK